MPSFNSYATFDIRQNRTQNLWKHFHWFSLFLCSKSNILFDIQKDERKKQLTWCPISISVSLNPNGCVERIFIFTLSIAAFGRLVRFTLQLNVSHFCTEKQNSLAEEFDFYKLYSIKRYDSNSENMSLIHQKCIQYFYSGKVVQLINTIKKNLIPGVREKKTV